MNIESKNGEAQDFIRAKVASDVKSGRYGGRVETRFPPEPNGYLHIGHAKAVCLDFGVAREFGGVCHLRMDDTDPTKESMEYVDAIMEDIRWLGFDWGEHLYFASDLFEKMYECAQELIRRDKAYVCDLMPEEWNEYRGTLTSPGKASPYRTTRSVAENLALFEQMRNGEFADGAKVLRAKIDMASPNIHLRDPALYRIRRRHHFRQGDAWCIYPMYDFAHCLEDYFERITHSFCTLEFEIHRPMYDWVLTSLGFDECPEQTEFARLNLAYTIMSKRKLLELAQGGHVGGWDDPRLPTIRGLRRRGCTPESIRAFCEIIGVTKTNSLTDVALLEHCIREDLNRRASRYLAVMDPVKVVIDNYPVDQVEMLDAVNNPEDPSAGSRKIPFSKELYIDRNDFMESPPPKFFRLAPGREVRLRYGYFITCVRVERDDADEITALHCTYDPETRGGNAPDGRKVKGTIHWVSAAHAVKGQARLYDRLFAVENPGADGEDYLSQLNPCSLETKEVLLEPALAENARIGEPVQFERQGYFCKDQDSMPTLPVFNRTVALRDSWAKMSKR